MPVEHSSTVCCHSSLCSSLILVDLTLPNNAGLMCLKDKTNCSTDRPPGRSSREDSCVCHVPDQTETLLDFFKEIDIHPT